MYGNAPLGGEPDDPEFSPTERRHLRRDLESVAARTRELLPGDFIVGSELRTSPSGPTARIAVRPPIGSPVTADYDPDDPDRRIDPAERDELATGLAASAALEVKRAFPDDPPPAG
ncbi:MAG: DUF5811 family protein [Salinirussus sp.]